MNPGDILDNRYQILERLGAGGMGEVYKATHLHLGATRVIKVIHPHISGNADAAERFIREARTSTKVQHPNVATLFDFSSLPDGSHYMVWEYIDGENLAQRLRARGTLPPRQAIAIIIQALHGLEAIHRAGIVHRDISPENLMISHADDTVKIIDLGVAKVEDATSTSQTRTGMFVGKLRYAAPEQLGFIPEGEKIDGRTDVYATAMVLVELLTGRPPYEAKSPHEYFIMHASQAPLKTAELPAELPASAELQAVIEIALARDRNQRFATARDFALALQEIDRSLVNVSTSATTLNYPVPDATMQLPRPTQPDLLHRTTQVSSGVEPVAAATLLTPVPTAQQGFNAQQGFHAQPGFQPQVVKKGSMLPLLVVGIILLFTAGGVALALLWPFGKKADDPVAVPTTTTTAAQTTTQPAKVAEASVTVTTETGEPVTQTVPTATIVETQTAPPVTQTQPPPVTETQPPVRPQPRPREQAPVQPREEQPAEEEPAPRPRPSGPLVTYVDGGDDDDANERALNVLRTQLRGTKVIAVRAGGMQVEVTRAIREAVPGIEFEAYADVTVRFDGTLERRSRGIKRRAASAVIEKNGRPIFRYQLPDELYRVGDAPAEAFARVLANAMEE
jgi:serine/threonine protein kinase